MIKRVKILYRRIGTWARGSSYENAPITPLEDGDVLFNKFYERRTPTRRVWADIRKAMFNHFFAIFFPNVIWRTGASDRPVITGLEKQRRWVRRRTPEGLWKWISPELDKKISEEPEAYHWNRKMKKWHLDFDEYVDRTVDRGGDIDIAVGMNENDTIYDYSLLDNIQAKVDKEKPANRTFSIILFVYPDKYDEEIRMMAELVITFW